MEDGRGLDLERVDARICEMIGAAALAGGYSVLIRTDPDCRGFERLRAKYSQQVEALAGEIGAEAGRWSGLAPARFDEQ